MCECDVVQNKKILHIVGRHYISVEQVWNAVAHEFNRTDVFTISKKNEKYFNNILLEFCIIEYLCPEKLCSMNKKKISLYITQMENN